MPLDFRTELHNAPDWAPYADDATLLNHAYRDSNIPAWCINILWQTVQWKPIADSTESNLQDQLDSPLSLAEFKEGICDTKTNSAVMPYLSYNMLKSLPDKAMKYYYAGFTHFWLSDCVVASWKWRWLNTIPKSQADNPSPGDLRPLMLCEVLRKI